MRFVLAVLLFFVVSFPICAQQDHWELQNKLKNATDNQQRLTVYENMFKHYELYNIDSALICTRQGLEEFTVDKFKPGIASMLNCLGAVYSVKGMLDAAEKANEESLRIYTDIDDKTGIAYANNALGVIDGRRGYYKKAIAHFMIALQIFKISNDSDKIAQTFIKLGAANELSGNLDKAIEYYQKGIAFVGNRRGGANLIFLNNNIASTYLRKKNSDSGSKYTKIALELSGDPSMAIARILPLNNLATLLASEGNTEAAVKYYYEAMDIADRYKRPDEQSNLLIDIASTIEKKNPLKALKLLQQALKITELSGQKKRHTEILEAIAVLHAKVGEYEKSYEVLVLRNRLYDSLQMEENENENAGLAALYEVNSLHSKIEQFEVEALHAKQKWNTIATTLIVLSLAFLMVVFLLVKTKRLNKSLANQKFLLKESNDIKDKLFSIIGHDLRGPVGTIAPALELCRHPETSKEERDYVLLLLEQSANTCSETLDNLLNWGKSMVAGHTISRTNLVVNDAIKNEIKLVNYSAEIKGIILNNNITDKVMVYADINQLRFIIRNLLSNAVKFTPEKGRVELDAKMAKDGTTIIFSIKDNGVGMTDEQKLTIFETYGLSKPGTNNEKGIGIGLKLCKEFVVAAGGNIWVESQLTKGSTFYFTLNACK